MISDTKTKDQHPPSIHPVVYDRVDHRVRHGQPVEAKVDVLDVSAVQNLTVVILVEEEALLWQPAQHEHHDDHDKHTHHL